MKSRHGFIFSNALAMISLVGFLSAIGCGGVRFTETDSQSMSGLTLPESASFLSSYQMKVSDWTPPSQIIISSESLKLLGTLDILPSENANLNLIVNFYASKQSPPLEKIRKDLSQSVTKILANYKEDKSTKKSSVVLDESLMKDSVWCTNRMGVYYTHLTELRKKGKTVENIDSVLFTSLDSKTTGTYCISSITLYLPATTEVIRP